MDAAAAAGLSERRAYEWLRRFRAGGERMLHDRSSAPARSLHAVPHETVVEIERLRRERLTGEAIASGLGLKRSTVGGVLRRLGLGRLQALDPKPPVICYDNGNAYRSHLFREALLEASCRHIRTRPYTPKTNGKAERFTQTSLREWAYAQICRTSDERTHAMKPWINRYNHARPHSALGGRPRVSRLNYVLGFDI